MLVAFPQDLCVIHKWLLSTEDSDHSWKASLEQPDELIEIVKRYVERLGSDKNRSEVSLSNRL